MAPLDILRNNLIDKILTISDRDYLTALNKLILTNQGDQNIFKLTEEQKLMLQMSEDDVINNRIISQEDLDKQDLQWLGGL